MAGKRFYNRVCRAKIMPKEGGNGTVLDGFDVQFEVEKTLEQEPNKAKFTFFNLPEDLRNKLQLKDDSTITFEAGYKDNVFVLFEGNVQHAVSGLQGPDYVTFIEAAEGHKAYRKSFVAKTYGPGTPFKTVVEDIVKSFEGMKVTPQITQVISNVSKTFPSGLTIDGSSAKVLNDILKGVNLGFSIQNGQLQILAHGTATDKPIVSLDYASGLVNIPQLGEKKDKSTITFECFLRPEMVPGQKVLLLEPLSVKGTYAASKVTAKGSNFDNEYYDYVEAFIP